MSTLKLSELLSDWTEPDVAEYYLACVIGIMDYESEKTRFQVELKGVFWTKNRVSDALYQMLESMVVAGMLEKNEDWDYRWNSSFKGYWEGGKAGL